MKKKNFKKILEYGIYHDNLEKKISLPGIKNGFPIKSFFKQKSNIKINDFEYLTQDIIDSTLKKIDNINLLCSGGVDSSLLVCFLNKNKKNFLAINNYYPNHKLNDLLKINSLSKFQKIHIKKIKISPKNYLKGMRLSFENKYFGNTYAPTLYYCLNSIKKNKNKILMTGSGPDELFYGMEKYNFKFISNLSSLKTHKALEILDTNYNYNFYEKIVNSYGIEILNEIKKTRIKLYKKIADISTDILEAQRILSYCTVTNQHYEMFEKISKDHQFKHVSPFLNINYIRFAFSFRLKNFLDLKNKKIQHDTNIGKKQLKIMLAQYTSKKHAYDNKIGFHAPISKLIDENKIKSNIENYFNLEKLEQVIDIDKLISYTKKNKKERLNYNIYSLIGLNRMIS